MPRLSISRGNGLEQATLMYEANLAMAGDFLTARGIGSATAKRYRLGYVQKAFSDAHQGYEGRISIPYTSRAGVVALRFRAVDPDADPKYIALSKTRVWLYNVAALYDSPPVVALCEGELDAIVTSAYAGIPAVGIAGAAAWRPEFARCFESVDRVLVCGDGDAAGGKMVEKLTDEIPNATAALMPAGHDANSFYLANGASALRDYLLERV